MEVPTKTYVDNLHEKSRNGQELLSLNKDHDNQYDSNKITNSDSITVNRESDNEFSNKKFVDNVLNKKTIVSFNQPLENCLKVSVGNVTNNLTKHDQRKNTDTTIITYLETGGYLLPY